MEGKNLEGKKGGRNSEARKEFKKKEFGRKEFGSERGRKKSWKELGRNLELVRKERKDKREKKKS